MKPKTVFVNTPASVATRYEDHRRNPARASARYVISLLQTRVKTRADGPGEGFEA